MATASELISNRGDANLGLGSDAGIPVSYGKNLDPINQAGRDSMLLDIDQQRQLFNRKVKDKDELLKLLGSGDIKVGDHLERDMPVIKKALDDLDEAWAERARKGFNNIDATVAYNKALRRTNDTVTQAQARFIIDKQVNADAAGNDLPSEREGILKEHENYLGNFWGDYKPHVKAFTIDHPGMTSSILRDSLFTNSGVTAPNQKLSKRTVKGANGKITTIDFIEEVPTKSVKTGSVQTPGKLSMFTTVPGKYYDFEKVLANASDDFHDEKQRLNQTKYMDFVLNKTSPAQLKGIIDQANSRIKKYNEQRGLETPDYPGYVDPIDVIVAPDGSRQTSLSVPEFNAKMALAGVTGDYFEPDKTVLDKEAAQIIQAQKQLAETTRHNKATEGNDWLKYNLDKDKFTETVKGAEEHKTAAMVFADNMLNDIISYGTSVGNGHYLLTAAQVRKMTGEQLKYLGRDLPSQKDALGNVTQSGGLQPLELKDGEGLYINPDGTIRVVSTIKDKGKGDYELSFDKERGTSVFNIGRNVLNEENKNAGSNERNAFINIDTRNRGGRVQVDVTGGGTTKSGSTTNKDKVTGEEKDWKREGKYFRYKDGTLYDDDGNVIKEK